MADTSVIACDEIISVMETTNTIATNVSISSNDKK